jgi:hypothetical protein
VAAPGAHAAKLSCMTWLLKLPAMVLFLALTAVSALAAAYTLQPLLNDLSTHWPLLAAFGGGLVLGSFRRLVGFYRTLEHELTHVLFALLCFQRPKHMVVTDQRGGEAGFTGSGNFLISLAPYFFPLTAILLLGIAAIAAMPWYTWIVYLLTFALGYHVTVAIAEICIGQTDLSGHGTPFSLTVILGFGTPIEAVLLAYAAFGAGGFSTYGHAWVDAVRIVFAWVRARIG